MRIALCEKSLKSSRMIKDVCDDILIPKRVKYELVQYASVADLLDDEFPDILFLEIKEMGLLVRDILSAMHAQTYIIFLAEDKEQVLEAFGKNVCGYLIYPLETKMVHFVLHASVLECLERKYFLYCKYNNNIEKIFFQDILYIQAYGRYTKVFVRGENEYRLSDKCISDWTELVQDLEFVSPHRSYIVNCKYVENIEKNIQLLDGQKVPCSKERRERFHQKYRREEREEDLK